MTTLAIHFTAGEPCELTLAGNHLITVTLPKDEVVHLMGALKRPGAYCVVTGPKGTEYHLTSDQRTIYLQRAVPLFEGINPKTAHGYLSPARRVALLKKLEKFWVRHAKE